MAPLVIVIGILVGHNWFRVLQWENLSGKFAKLHCGSKQQ